MRKNVVAYIAVIFTLTLLIDFRIFQQVYPCSCANLLILSLTLKLILSGVLLYAMGVYKGMLTKLETDHLTGAASRSTFFNCLDKIAANPRRRPNDDFVSIVLLDVDSFKSINDTYGHHRGDQVLKNITRIAREITRQHSKEICLCNSDFFARLGGEEFGLLLPHTAVTGAAALAERLRATIEDQYRNTSHPVTASFGVAQLREDETVKELYLRTDNLTYQAKLAGKNIVVCDCE